LLVIAVTIWRPFAIFSVTVRFFKLSLILGMRSPLVFCCWGDNPERKLLIGFLETCFAEHVRGYLKTTADRAWRLVNWLTHAANATRSDAEPALNSTSHVINNYALAVLKKRIDAPERCGRCNSYKITVDWRPDLGQAGMYVPRCESCGAEKLPQRARPRKAKNRRK
jgi:hypothetical protein